MGLIFYYILGFHILGALFWLGESVIVNFVLYPALRRDEEELKSKFVLAVYRRLFNICSVSASVTVLSGLWLLLRSMGNQFFDSKIIWIWTMFISVGIGIGLIILHVLEKVTIVKLKKLQQSGELNPELMMKKLKVIPRLTLTGLTIIFLMMVNLWFNWF
ncbi:MAG: hypothetical protein JKY54_05850 [Flavobacteriales bacterium]|nr:hypothetical protein [Flavobacteriales bacterium]